jgi:hypothetical protein
MDPLVALVAGSGWAAGVNLYLTVALLGLAGRFDLAEMPELLTSPWVIGAALTLFAVEFVADKVPYLDNAWDAAHTLVRPLGAALLGYALTGEADAALRLAAAGGSGVLALGSHAAKATARAAINTSPEPVSNIAASLGEDGLVAVVLWLAVANPVVALVAVAVLALSGVALTVALWRFVVRLRRRRRAAGHVDTGAR